MRLRKRDVPAMFDIKLMHPASRQGEAGHMPGNMLLSPERRRQLVMRLTLMTDDWRLSPDLRRNAERHLRNQKAMQRTMQSALDEV